MLSLSLLCSESREFLSENSIDQNGIVKFFMSTFFSFINRVTVEDYLFVLNLPNKKEKNFVKE